ncbi:TAF6-like RNA polymerase II p300/CBP-associated factor-associated factor 65 kDa subunit 6L isoform X1 [Cimex lectularius]|uniref:Transcription initiation factor TFIID subunit 6 n=1 Tax=Cimex lectularius TaxID=79782 RepID=A0A8I6S1Z5_CIMLE|nr:TAF6-like RNA polymerase II p300/CBP-associated factor-associated factor 65 kDa subunit 6L isoform X1 [Cimex lectularius]
MDVGPQPMEIAEQVEPDTSSTQSTSQEGPPVTKKPRKKKSQTVDHELKMFCKRSVYLTGSRIGIPSLSEEVCDLISNELFCKTRELMFVAKIILHQNKRDMLTTHDVDKAIKLLGGVQLYGHHNAGETSYTLDTKKNVFVENDEEIDVYEESLQQFRAFHRGEPYIQGAWVMPEESTDNGNNAGHEESSYYVQICKTLMLGSLAHKRVALLDLKSNPKIGPYCPYFLNLVALTVKKGPQHGLITTTMIDTVSCIAENRFVDPSPFLAVNRAVNSLLKIVIEKNIESSNCDDLGIRLRAGLLLSKVMILWSIELKQQMDIVRHLLQHLLDNTAPFQTQYGVIVTLTALRQRTLDFYYWPVIERYLPQLEIKSSAKRGDSLMVYSQYIMGVILISLSNAFRKLFANSGDYIMQNRDEKLEPRIQVDESVNSSYRKNSTNTEQFNTLLAMDKRLYTIFGDSVTPLRMLRHTNIPPTYLLKPKKRPPLWRLRFGKPIENKTVKKYNVMEIFDIKPKSSSDQPLAQRSNRTMFKIKRKLPTAIYYSVPLEQKRYHWFIQRKTKSLQLYRTCCSGNLLANL